MTVQIRVGLNSGDVVVRAIGNDLHMDYSAIGQTTHLAARMEQLATPGTILLTAATLRLVEGLVQVTTLGPVPVKGLPEPMEVFELVGATAIRRRLQAAVARGLTPLCRAGDGTRGPAAGAGPGRGGPGPGGRPGRGGRAWASRAWSTSSSTRTTPRAGGAGEHLRLLRQGHGVPPGLDLLKAYCQIEDRDDLGPSGPRSPGRS